MRMMEGANLMLSVGSLESSNSTYHRGATKVRVVGFMAGMYRAASHIGEAGSLWRSASVQHSLRDDVPSKTADDGLETPSVSVVDVSNFE
jgi:hypothetical protein